MLRGERVRSLRLSRKLTHQDLAELLDMGVRQVARYESGETEPNGEILARIAQVFNVSTDYLLGTTDDPMPHVQPGVLTDLEWHIISSVRSGDKLEAIKAIVESA